ncbi:PAQR family membrane homeostasis protein TrhA [Reinekea thalattae]|nr:hemolysin III family protein [Reinekea thalattae]
MAETMPRYGFREELANSLTHGLGAFLAIIGLVAMLLVSVGDGSVWKVVSASIYGAALIAMFLASTLYHSVQAEGARRVLRQADHLAILYLIAGTYTPLTLVTLSGAWGWSLFGVIWGLTLIGTVLQLSPARHVKALMVTLYLIMGWVAVIAARPLIANMDATGLALIVGGGLAYSGGVVFYVNKKIPFNHAIWHLFVMAGAFLHYFAILFYVL